MLRNPYSTNTADICVCRPYARADERNSLISQVAGHEIPSCRSLHGAKLPLRTKNLYGKSHAPAILSQQINHFPWNPPARIC